MTSTYRFLDWDSSFFGYRIARAVDHRFTEQDAEHVDVWCAQHEIDCLYFLADADHAGTVELLEAHGFGLKDVRMTYVHHRPERRKATFPTLPGEMCIRLSRPMDIPLLEAIAATAHTDTRFYFDCRFPASEASRLYQIWIRKSCEQDGSTVLVLEDSVRPEPVGYISCALDGDRAGHIGLVGIAAGYRGQGLGGHLVRAALDWFAQHDATVVSVVTQARNVQAQRLYQRSGFTVQVVQLWYHKWFTNLRERVPSG